MPITSPDMTTRATTLLRHTDYSITDKPRDASASVSRSCNCELAIKLSHKRYKLTPNYYRKWIRSYMWSIEWCHFQRPWWPVTLIFWNHWSVYFSNQNYQIQMSR